ncbi:biotin transporter BioY [Agromyces soli]
MSTAPSTTPDGTPESGTPATGTSASDAPAVAAPRRRSTARDLAQIAVFAALIAALGLPGAIPLGPEGVPITAQTLGVMLAGAILGARKGVLSVLLLLALVAAGLPLLSGGRGGLGVFVGPSVGYLIGWVAGVAVIGWATARLLPRYRIVPALLWTALGGIVVVYAFGVPFLAAVTGMPLELAIVGQAWFLVGDAIKVVVTVLVAKGVHRAWPGLIEPKPWPWAARAKAASAAAGRKEADAA